MLKIILQDTRFLQPFNEKARDIRIQNKPLWLLQRDVLAPFITREQEILPGEVLPDTVEPCLIYRDNLYFNSSYLDAFLDEVRQRSRPCRAAFAVTDASFREHALPLSTSYTPEGDLYLADLWYLPNGTHDLLDPLTGLPDSNHVEPVMVNSQPTEAGYYHVPTYMAYEQGDLTFQVPQRSFLAIDSWVHIFVADVIFGQFGRAQYYINRLDNDLKFKLKILFHALYEARQVLTCSQMVTIGKNCTIHPGAQIFGPTTIGNNVTIDAGVVIENCIIGDNVNIGQGCQLMLSVVGDGAFLPFRASLFMTTVMDNSMVAQNTCLQMCVIGRNTFIGAGSTFTDFNLLPAPLRAMDGNQKLSLANRPVLGGCVGHNCRLGAGLIIFPARMVESDVVLYASKDRHVIERNIPYEESDHHKLSFANLHLRLYPRHGESRHESW